MFDLITGRLERPLQERSPISKGVSVAGHVVVFAIVAAISWRASTVLPRVPMMTNVFLAPTLQPPPPPPPAARAPAAPRVEKKRPEQSVAVPMPVEPIPATPIELVSQTALAVAGGALQAGTGIGVAGGVEGGVEGGIAGGIVGGLLGGLISAAPPPSPPAPPAEELPVRIGGRLDKFALIHRVEPIYPRAAVALNLRGLVILEAVIDTSGYVESVSVLRSCHPLLDKAAADAVKQWRYKPLVLNGIPVPFVLTVTINFSSR